MRKTWLILTIILAIVLVACGQADETSSSGGSAPAVENSSDESQDSLGTALLEDYNDALSIQSQLAVGTLLLEGTELAVDEALAAELYPLWQAVQSLMDSDTAAEVEVEAVVSQIQDTMAPEQVTAIAEMQLTGEGLTTLLEEGALQVNGGGFGRGLGASAAESESGRPGGGPGGLPGGGRPGGGPGGEGFPEGLDPDAIATRQAEFAGGDAGSLQDRMMIGAVVRLLGAKTGELAAEPAVRIFDKVFEVVAETTGLPVEDIRAQTADGTTLAEIIEANDSDLEAVYDALVLALGELPNADELDLELVASQWLGLKE